MKTLLLAVLFTFASTANSAVLCQSMKDPQYQAWFEGYSCPDGFFIIKFK